MKPFFEQRLLRQGTLLLLILTTALAGLAQSGTTTDHRGRYAMRLSEGVHTITISAPGHTTAWRQVVMPAGAAVDALGAFLDELGPSATAADGTEISLQHGGETAVTLPATLSIPAGTLPTGTTVTFTSVGQQSLAGLLPHGWSPLGSAEIRIRPVGG